VFQQCDVSKLTPERLAELSKDHEAIGAFRSALGSIADKIPQMQDSKAFEGRLKAAVNDALQAWQRDKANMSKVSKETLGTELLKPTGDFIKTLVERFAASMVGTATVGAVEGGVQGALVGAAGGFMVALIVHAVSSWNKAKERERGSPYRYLTQLEKAGVAFAMSR